MPLAMGEASQDTRRIVVTSVGTAGPTAAAAIARGLGVPVNRAVACLYRAPAVLAEGVPAATAPDFLRLLMGIGLTAEAAPQAAPPPPPPLLRDVALHLDDPRALPEAAAALARFTGMQEDAALAMILAPPGVVLGTVSDATVAALAARLPAGASLVAARPEDSAYHLFLLDGPEVVRARLMPDLAALGVPADAPPGLVATDVPHRLVRDLWQRHQAGGMLRAVNSAFLRYDIVLAGLGTARPEDPALAEALAREAGMPAEVLPEILGALPVTLAEGVAHGDLAGRLGALAATGLELRAELTTFQRLGLEVLSAPAPEAVRQVLRGFGCLAQDAPLPRPPFALDGALPEAQARVLRAALEDAGAEVRFTGGSA